LPPSAQFGGVTNAIYAAVTRTGKSLHEFVG